MDPNCRGLGWLLNSSLRNLPEEIKGRVFARSRVFARKGARSLRIRSPRTFRGLRVRGEDSFAGFQKPRLTIVVRGKHVPSANLYIHRFARYHSQNVRKDHDSHVTGFSRGRTNTMTKGVSKRLAVE